MFHLIKCTQNTRTLLSSAMRHQSIDSMISLNKPNITHKLVRNYSSITLRPYLSKTIIYGSSLTGLSFVIACHHKFGVAKCDSSSLSNEHIEDGENSDNSLLECVDYVRSHENFNISKLWPYLKLDTIYFIVAISSALIVAIINIEIPICLGSVMNVLSRFASNGQSLWSNHFLTEVKNPALKVFELYVFQSIFTFLYISSLSIIGEKMASRLRKQLFANIIRFDAAFYDSHKSGEIISRLTSDVQEFKSSFKMCISQGLRSTTQIIGCSISLFISPPMTVLMGTIVPGMVLVGTFIGSFLRNMSKEAQAQVAKASGIACEAINNVRTVKAFAMEESQSSVYNKEINISEELNCNLGVGIGIFQGITNLALNSIVLGTLLFGGYLLSKEEMSAGNLMSFLVAVQTIQRSLAQLSLLFGQYIRGVSAANRIFEYLQINECHSDTIGIKLSEITGEISFRNVTFSYPTRSEILILKNFNINLMPGKVTAICGLSGEGKSTIAALLEKFYDVNSGAITIDGIDLRELDTLWLRRDVVGYINQEPVLFATTIKENIRFGKPDATDEEIYAAAKVANAHAFIQSFPDGYETLVGERGVTVSGGQKQRIAIARAIIKNPKILILDEATSALDSESEATVQQAIENIMNGRTVLVIAHRLTTIQNADVIAVISNGKIVESGKHYELLKHKRIYWQLFSQQSNYFSSIEE